MDSSGPRFAERIERYRAIEARRRRPLIAYATSTRPGVPAMMAADAIREFVDQIDAIPRRARRIDVLIHSTGGDALTAWKLMSLLRGRFEQVGVLVPFSAFSAATLFALGADEIVMHPHASLGPIDPQILAHSVDGTQIRFAYEDVGAFLRFVAEDVRLSEPSAVSGILDRLLATVNPLQIGGARRASDLSGDVAARLLGMHMTSAEDAPKAREIAQRLNKSFFSHSDAISRGRARELELRVAPDDPCLEALLWEAFLAIEAYMDLRQRFDPLEHFLKDARAAESVAPLTPLRLPIDAPPQLVQQIWSNVAAVALGATSARAIEVPFTHTVAAIESGRRASAYEHEGVVIGARVGLRIDVAVTVRAARWRSIPCETPDSGASRSGGTARFSRGSGLQ